MDLRAPQAEAECDDVDDEIEGTDLNDFPEKNEEPKITNENILPTLDKIESQEEGGEKEDKEPIEGSPVKLSHQVSIIAN